MSSKSYFINVSVSDRTMVVPKRDIIWVIRQALFIHCHILSKNKNLLKIYLLLDNKIKSDNLLVPSPISSTFSEVDSNKLSPF